MNSPRLGRRRRFVVLVAAAAVHWSAMAYLTHRPFRETDPAKQLLAIPHIDVVLHAGGFFILAVLLNAVGAAYRSLHRARPEIVAPRIATVTALIAVYAALDEWLQPLTGRACELKDFASDMAGAALGIVCFRLAARAWNRRHAAETAAS